MATNGRDGSDGIAFRLYLAREDRGVSRRRLADAIGVSEPTIARWETQMRIPANRTVELETAAQLLEVHPQWLAEGEDAPQQLRPRLGHRALCAVMSRNWAHLDAESADMLAAMIKAAIDRARRIKGLAPLPPL